MSDNELKTIEGGGLSFGAIVGIAAGITFLIGIIDGIVRPLKCNQEEYMKELNNLELLNIVGGINWTASLFGYMSKAIETVLDVGRSLGSAIRRLYNGTLCPF